tara:strand:- start:1961 stop:2890 length:930 start_codon:yes stop_codon:yes gene_type:complete
MLEKVNVLKLRKMKENNEAVAWVTAYDFPFAYAAEQARVDMILVGDSGGMVQLGYETTNPVTMDEMIMMAKAARRGAPNTFMIGDMPQGSYEVSNEEAVKNALRFIKEAGCDAVKLEGGKRVHDRVKSIVDAGILAMGHLGLTPQSTSSFGGYKVQGKTRSSFLNIQDDSISLVGAGVFSILLEAMPTEPAGAIARGMTPVPVYGIGAGSLVDGQLVIMHDLMGFYQAFRPWFAKCYIPEVCPKFSAIMEKYKDLKSFGREGRKDGLLELAEMAIRQYVYDVKNGIFPSKEYCYPLKEEEMYDMKGRLE